MVGGRLNRNFSTPALGDEIIDECLVTAEMSLYRFWRDAAGEMSKIAAGKYVQERDRSPQRERFLKHGG
jgi:hypothetical protein